MGGQTGAPVGAARSFDEERPARSGASAEAIASGAHGGLGRNHRVNRAAMRRLGRREQMWCGALTFAAGRGDDLVVGDLGVRKRQPGSLLGQLELGLGVGFARARRAYRRDERAGVGVRRSRSEMGL